MFDIADDLAPAQVDPNHLELALLNLAVNARDAMSGRGRLTIVADAYTADDQHHLVPGEYIRLSVSDTGSGMDEDTRRRATEPFFTTKGVGEGTGLGLSAVQGLAEQSGGAFRLESKLGCGTTATLWLPVSEQAVADEEFSESEPVALPVLAGARPVLLVDDEELVRTGIAAMLTEVGYEVVEAGSAYQALDLLNDGLEVDALITDYAMPGMTGVELAREARSLKPTLHVLLITGYAAVSDYEAGGLARLAKPFGQAHVSSLLSTSFSRRVIARLQGNCRTCLPERRGRCARRRSRGVTQWDQARLIRINARRGWSAIGRNVRQGVGGRPHPPSCHLTRRLSARDSNDARIRGSLPCAAG